MVKISVVMSVFNAEKFLSQAIESILQQTFTDFEFIIVNDGSNDNSVQIIKSFKDSRIRLLSQPNNGVPAALNKGISIAKGNYIARMDADDISLENRLQLQYDFMQEHPQIDILGGQAYLIDDNNNVIGIKQKPINSQQILLSAQFVCPLIHPTYFAKASVYKALNGYRNFFRYAQDYDFILRALDSNYKLYNIDSFILKYRIFSNNNNNADKTQLQMYMTRMIQKLHKQRKIHLTESSNTLNRVITPKLYFRRWFFFWNKYRIKFIGIRANTTNLFKPFINLLILLCSIMHFELLFSTIKGYRYLKIANKKFI